MTDTLFQATDNNQIAALLAVDQSSAFDCVSHSILLRKLSMYNISQETLQWFESYLSQRSQCVSIGTKLSSFQPVLSGVPQGSVLGPILFALYTNELSGILNEDNQCHDVMHNDNQFLFNDNCPSCGSVISYADDITVVLTNPTRDLNLAALRTTLDKMDAYLTSNKLAINRTKTVIHEVMIGQKRARQDGNPPCLQELDPNGNLKLIKAGPQ